MNKLLLCMGLLATTAGAEIEWATKEITLQVLPTQVSAEAVFEFANTGDEPATIDHVQITCGCLSTKPVRKSYAPGEKGQLVIRFSLINRTGKQRKHVVVETDGGKSTDLAIAADIPELYLAEPKLLIWKKDDTTAQKTIHLKNPNTIPIKLLSITSSHEGLPVQLKTIREGFEYEVIVTRQPGAQNARSVIRIATEPPPDLKESKALKLYVYAQ